MYDEKCFRLDGRVAVVIGAGSGIGRASAFALARHGARVVCADLSAETAGSAAAEIREHGGTAEARAVNVSEEQSVQALFHEVAERFGGLHVAVTTPAVNVRKALLDYTAADFDRVINLNLKGTFFVMRAAGKIMAEAGGGSIVAFSSIRGQVVEPGQSVYAATKAGVVQMVRALAAELGPRNVRVNAVAPGIVDTPLTAPIKKNAEWANAYAAKSVFGRWATPEEVAGPVVFLASGAASYITGSVLLVDGGWTAADGRFTPPL